jgi:hypothetical protein
LTGTFCILGAAWFTLQLPKIRPAMRIAYRERELSAQRESAPPNRSVSGTTPLGAELRERRISTSRSR